MSWTELMVGLSIIILVWYSYIILKHYRKELAGLFIKESASHEPVKWQRNAGSVSEAPAASTKMTNPATDTHGQVHELMEELKLVFAAANRDQLMKEQILEALSERLHKYLSLPINIRQSVNQHLTHEFSLRLKITVTAEQMNDLWK